MSRTLRTIRQLSPFIALTVAIVALSAVPAAAQSYWFEDYQRLVVLIDKGQHQEASKLLDRLVSERPFPASCVRIPGDRCIDYLPYYQRARIELALNNTRGASRSLDIEGAFGAVLRNRRTERDFLQLRHQVEETIAASAQSRSSIVVPAVEPK
jgi:hypothetical protein